MKKQLSVILAALMLASCAWQDKGGTNPNEDNDKVLSVENAETGSVSALYEGYEELQGKQIGKSIIMPDVITPQEINEVYVFEMDTNVDTENIEQRGKEFFNRIFGDSYDESLAFYDVAYITGRMPSEAYNSNGLESEGAKDPDNFDTALFPGFPYIVMRDDGARNMTMEASYDPIKNENTVMALDEGSFTVGDICDSALDFFDREMKGFEGVNVIVESVRYYRGEVDGKSHGHAEVYLSYEKSGVPVVNWGSVNSEIKKVENGTETTQFAAPFYTMIFGGKDNILDIHSAPPEKVTSEKKLDSIISLKTAAELLGNNLGEEMRIKLESVDLVYCRKVTNFYPNSNGDDAWKEQTFKIHEFQPLWLFGFAKGQGHLVVDAQTGQIIIDAQGDVLNSIYGDSSDTDTESKSEAPVEKITITAETKSYRDGKLTFEYEGKEYILPMEREQFVRSVGSDPSPEICLSEYLINNPYGITLTAKIEITSDMNTIMSCALESKNVKNVQDDINAVYHMRHDKGSIYTFSSDTETYYFDLNTTDNIYKVIIPEDKEVLFECADIGGDKLVLKRFREVIGTELDEDGNIVKLSSYHSNYDKYHYCAVVQSVDADKAVIKLNYTGKELTVPPYLTDGEIKVGAQVVVTLGDTPEELLASKEQERDFAVFYTDPEKILDGEEFEDIAYCTTKLTAAGYKFEPITIEEAEG